MAIFEDIELEWEGETRTVKSNQRMRLNAAIEEEATAFQLSTMRQTRDINMSKLSYAFAAALRFAGFRITVDEVSAGLWKNINKSPEKIQEAIDTLLGIIVPPSVMSDLEGEGEEDKEVKPPKKAKGGKS